MSKGNGGGRRITAKIAGVMPAACHIVCLGIFFLIQIILKKNGSVHMAGIMSINSGVFLRQIAAASLIVQRLDKR